MSRRRTLVLFGFVVLVTGAYALWRTPEWGARVIEHALGGYFHRTVEVDGLRFRLVPFEVEIEVRDPNTGTVTRGSVQDGFDPDLLARLAEVGAGRYFFAGSAGALRSVFDSIDTMEQQDERSLLRVIRDPRDGSFILIGLVLIMFDFVIRRLFAREIL